MALSHLLTFLFLLASTYSLTPKCTDDQKSTYSPVNLTESLGRWNLIVGAYSSLHNLNQDKQIKFAWIEISKENGVVNFIYSLAMVSSLITRRKENLQVSEGPDGITFAALGDNILTVKKKASEGCIIMNVPYDGDTGLILACRAHTAPKSVIEDFTNYAACQNYQFTNVHENPINYASTCSKVLRKYPINENTEITGRWKLVAKASTIQKSPTTDDNQVDGWIEFTAHGDNEVTVQHSPDMTDVKEIEEGEYIIMDKEVKLKADPNSVGMTIYKSCHDSLLLDLKVLKPGSSRSNLLLFTKSGKIQEFEKEKFKQQALCENLPHVYEIPTEQHNATSCQKLFQKDPLKDISKILDRWTFVAKASNYKIAQVLEPNHMSGWIEFILNEDKKVSIEFSDHSRSDVDEIPNRFYSVVGQSLRSGSEWMSLIFYDTCEDDLLLLLVDEADSTPRSQTLMLFSKSGTVPDYEKRRFKVMALCEELTEFYWIPPAE